MYTLYNVHPKVHCIPCISPDKVQGATVYISPHGESIIAESNEEGWVMLVGLCNSDSDLIIHKNGYAIPLREDSGFDRYP